MARTKGKSEVKPVGQVPECFSELWSAERDRQGAAFQEILRWTDEPVDWADAVLDEMLLQLSHKNNRNRSIAAQVLCNLAKSDPSQRILRDFATLFEVVKDERFVTARHALQSMWKVAWVGERHRKKVLAALKGWYVDCVTHPNCTLIRFDIIESLRKLYDLAPDEKIRALATKLIEQEENIKYQKKYRALWPQRSLGGKA